MKRMFIFLVFIISFLFGRYYGKPSDVYIDHNLVKTYLKELNNLTEQQKYWMSYIYKKCSRFNLGKTCVAIAWEESQFGVFKVVPWSHDYGIMGINLYWYMKDNGYNYRNRYTRSKIATKLVCDNEYTIVYAIAKLEKIRSKRRQWKKVWAYYNGGTRPNWRYSKRILNRIIAFRIFMRNNPNLLV